jgi:squalene-hopene/tetraprenyl-beta-curcumene cyclase
MNAEPSATITETTPPAVLAELVDRACQRTVDYLLSRQHTDGHWCFELEGDSILESEYLLLQAFLGRHQSPLSLKVATCLLEQQSPSGGWVMYPGGSVDVSASVKAYFALKLTGYDPESEAMRRARAAILARGGADAVNSFTRFYLAFLGQISYNQCPAVPPEVALLPTWFPVNLYAMSAWSRAMVVTLSLIWAKKPVTRVEPSQGIAELFIHSPETWELPRCPGKQASKSPLSWDRFFRTLDGYLKWCERNGLMMFRGRAMRKAERWMIDRFQGSDGLGAIFPPMVWSIMALKALGYRDDSAELKYCLKRLDGLVLEDERIAWLQPCKSPVWDTAITLRALDAAGVSPQEPAVACGIDWLLANEVRQRGDWSKTVRAEPGGWCFEYANAFYPDVDDTVMVLMALKGSGVVVEERYSASENDLATTTAEPLDVHFTTASNLTDAHRSILRVDRVDTACDRAERWLRAMQNHDGGWGAFDRDNDREFLCRVPFADHNAMIDPSTPDLASRVLECFGKLGRQVGDFAVNRTIAYLRRTQEADGSWFGRWGVNYIYGTWQTICGLVEVGISCNDPMIRSGARWLVEHQHASGGWGESCDTYADPCSRGKGSPTASQTAWAVWGLIAAGYAWHPSVERGVRYLVDTQRPDGAWDEEEFTGTGFPQVFYLKYHGYSVYFPLIALGMYQRANLASRS